MTDSVCRNDQRDCSSPELANGGLAFSELPLRDELRACRAIAKRCAFVLGPARSGTTILAQIINGSDSAFLTTEGNYFSAGALPDFREWYNEQHRTFENQKAKVSYAPKFGDQDEHQWWQWLVRAAEHFETVGDKMAFSDAHMGSLDVKEFMEFFEARFFRSKFIFIFRNPLQCVLSAIGLWNRVPAEAVAGWCEFVKLWADFIRVFPSTMTVLLEQLDSARVAEVGDFLALDLSEGARLLDSREQRQHKPEDYGCGDFVNRVAPLLQMIYSEIEDSLAMARVFLQADQKRVRLDQGPRVLADCRSEIAVVTTPVGRAWNLAQQLISELGDESRP